MADELDRLMAQAEDLMGGGESDLDSMIRRAEALSQSPFYTLPDRLKPFAKLKPHEIEPSDLRRVRDPASAPLTAETLTQERTAYRTVAEQHYQEDMKGVSKSIATTGGPKFTARTDRDMVTELVAAGKPDETDWRMNNSPSGIAQREEFAGLQAVLAVHQYETASGQVMSDADRFAQLDYYREQAGLGGPVEYQHRRQWQQAEASRPEDMSAVQEGIRSLGRAPYEILRAGGNVAGIAGGLAESVGLEGVASKLQSIEKGSKLWTDRFLTKPGIVASQQAAQVWNPSSVNWWVNRGVETGTRLPIGIAGGVPGAMALGAMDAGGVYENILNETGDRQKAAQIAGVYSIAASITERFGAKVLMTDRQFSSKLMRAVWMSVYRGGTEGAQEGCALLSEVLGTGKMPEQAWQRLVSELAVAGVTATGTSAVRSLDYSGSVRPKRASDTTAVPVSKNKSLNVTTPKADDLPESIRGEPTEMRRQIHYLLTKALGSKEKATETQRQIAWEMFGKNLKPKQDQAVKIAPAADMESKAMGDEAAVRKAVEDAGGEFAGMQVDADENPAFYIANDPKYKTSVMLKDADDVGPQFEAARQRYEKAGPTQETFRLRDIEDVDQLAEIYDHAREYQPIGMPKVVDDPKLNASLETLAKRLNDEQKLDGDQYHGILTRLGLETSQGPVENMTRDQALRLRRHLMGAERTGEKQTLIRAAREQFKGIDEVIGDHEKAITSQIAKRRAEGKKGFSKIRSLQSMRHVCAQLEAQTGLPIRQSYDDLIEAASISSYAKTQWMADIFGSDRKAKKILNRRGEDAEKIRTAIWEGKVDTLSDSERAVAERIQKQFKDAEVEIKVRELYEYMQGADLPDVQKDILDMAQREYDQRGYSALYEIAESQEFGTRKNYYPKFEGRERLTLFQELSRYYDKVQTANRINPELNALNVLVEQATGGTIPFMGRQAGEIKGPHAKRRFDKEMGNVDLTDPKAVAGMFAVFNQSIRFAEPSSGWYGEIAGAVTKKALNAYYVTQIPTIRNFLQVLAMDNNVKRQNLPALFKRATLEDAEWDRTCNRQDRGLAEYMMQEPSRIPVVNQYDRAVQFAASSFAVADRSNRSMSAKLSLAQTRRAMDEAGPGWKDSAKGIYDVIKRSGIKARFDDVTVRRAVEELATKGEDAFARYIALQHTLDIQGPYHLYERSVAEMQAGPVLRRLGAFPRMAAEQWGRAAHTLFSRESSGQARDQAAVVLCQLMLGSWAANAALNELLGYDADSYTPWKIVQFTPGGIAADKIERIWNTCKTVATAVATGDLDTGLAAGHRAAKDFVPFYKVIQNVYEATEIGGPIKVEGNNVVQLKSPISKLQHALTGRKAQSVYDAQKRERREKREQREKRPQLIVEE